MKRLNNLIPISILVFILYCFNPIHAQDKIVIDSKLLPQNDSIYIFTPENYNIQEKYPVVYLLHGHSGDYTLWNQITDLQSYSDRYGFIIVCPDGLFDSWYVNSPVKENSKYEDFFFQELYVLINKEYQTDKNNIFITGLSMGGYGSLYLYANNTSKFKAVGSTSGLLDPLPFAQHYGINKIFGNYKIQKQNFIDYSIFNFIEDYKKSKYHILIDCGNEDPFYLQNKKFFEDCSKAGVNISFSYRPGNHNRPYWKESIKDHFQYFYYLSKKK